MLVGEVLEIAILFFVVGFLLYDWLAQKAKRRKVDRLMHFTLAVALIARWAVRAAGEAPSFDYVIYRQPVNAVDYEIIATHFLLCMSFILACWRLLQDLTIRFQNVGILMIMITKMFLHDVSSFMGFTFILIFCG